MSRYFKTVQKKAPGHFDYRIFYHGNEMRLVEENKGFSTRSKAVEAGNCAIERLLEIKVA